MIKFEVVEADSKENTITLDAGDYFSKGYVIELGEGLFLPEPKPNFPINKYEEDLAKASEILNKAHLPKIIDIAVNAIDDAITDIDMDAEQEWHAKITLESSLIEIAEQIANQPKLSIPKKIAELLDIGYACEGDEERDHSWLIHNMDDFTSPESYDEFYNWLEDSEDNYSLAIVYLAGKALGVDLVEVSSE